MLHFTCQQCNAKIRPTAVFALLFLFAGACIGFVMTVLARESPKAIVAPSQSNSVEILFWQRPRSYWEDFCKQAGLSDPDQISDVYGIVRVIPGTWFRVEVAWEGPVIEHVMVADLDTTPEAEKRVLDFWDRIDPRMRRYFEDLRDQQRKLHATSGPTQPIGNSGYSYGWSENNKAYVKFNQPIR